jgi:hypothetical protein
MAKKAKRSKSQVRKSKAKKAVKKARNVATTTAAAQPLNSLLVKEISGHVFKSLADKKSDAVNACINAEMDKVTNSWNDSGHMDKDYHQSQKSMVAFLSDVRGCLTAKGYDFNMNDPAFVKACVSAAVFQVKLLVYGRTK